VSATFLRPFLLFLLQVKLFGIGSPAYVSPDVLRGQGYGEAVDWWTLGVVMFQLLCGNLPFQGEDNKKVSPHGLG
jgi:serine/threonine protein kinase